MSAPNVSFDPSTPLHKALAIDTSTERMSVALGAGGPADPVAQYEGVGGSQASSELIPVILRLLKEAGWTLAELDVIAFGCGPGSFTGLRTACAVVQGLAVASRPGGVPVLPVNTLLAVAEEARWQRERSGLPPPDTVLAALDARMDEIYLAQCTLLPGSQGSAADWDCGPAWLSAPEALPPPSSDKVLLAGNAMALYGQRLHQRWQGAAQQAAWPTATALLRLAPALWGQGQAVPAALAQPLYVRDKVAQTTQEREQIKAARAQAAGKAPEAGA